MISRRALLAAGALGSPALARVGMAQPAGRKPRVPAGRDPGGVAVALIGSGIDYTRSAIAARLARDGEGDLIGRDLVDKDALPFERQTVDGLAAVPDAGSEMAGVLLAAAPAGRLVPVRVPDQSLAAIAEALSFVARTPTAIAILLARPPAGTTPEQLRDLVAPLPRLLVVMPRIEVVIPRPPNLIVVAPADAEGRPPSDEPADPTGIDLAITLTASIPAPASDQARRARHLAAVTLGALAVRLLAKERPADAAALKSRILALAQPAEPPHDRRPRTGLIAHPERHGQP